MTYIYIYIHTGAVYNVYVAVHELLFALFSSIILVGSHSSELWGAPFYVTGGSSSFTPVVSVRTSTGLNQH